MGIQISIWGEGESLKKIQKLTSGGRLALKSNCFTFSKYLDRIPSKFNSSCTT